MPSDHDTVIANLQAEGHVFREPRGSDRKAP